MCIRTQRKQGTALRVGSFNCRGIKQDLKKSNILQDLESYKIDILAVQETHLKGEGAIEIKSTTGNNYKFYYGGIDSNQKGKVNGGVGIIVNQDFKTEFKCITERICIATVSVGNRKHTIISAYAPTLPVSESKPEVREKFYQDLDSVIQGVSKRNFLTIGGDFNAKTGSGYVNHRENMGRFGRGELNSNGEHLLELAARHDLVLTNTLFEHKHAHITTWESPDKTEGKIVRNQIDYILVRNYHRIFIQDSRAYAGTLTFSDHRLVMTKMNINWIRKTPGKVTTKKYDTEKLNTVGAHLS